MGLRQAGRDGVAQSIADDIRLSRELFELAQDHPEIEAVGQGLSITTFRYVPPGVHRRADDQRALNALNERLLDALQRSGRAYV